MLVFLDDSGDPGFKVKKGSSPCFVIALVIFDDHLEAETCALEIKKLRRELGLSDHFEFKFSKCCDRFRKAFSAVSCNRRSVSEQSSCARKSFIVLSFGNPRTTSTGTPLRWCCSIISVPSRRPASRWTAMKTVNFVENCSPIFGSNYR